MKHLPIVALLLALPLTAHAGPKEKRAAKKHIAAATKAHKAQKWDVALAELQAAYELDPQPDLLFAIGQVQVKLENCPEAIMSYQKFLESKPKPKPTQAANEAIKTCQDELAAQQPPPPPTPEPTPAPAPAAPAPASHGGEANKAFYMDPIGDGLATVGVAASIVGIVFYSQARSKLDEADKARTYAQQQAMVDDAHSKRNTALIVGSIGAVAIGAAVWRYTRFGKQHREHALAIVPVTRGSGGVVTWIGRF